MAVLKLVLHLEFPVHLKLLRFNMWMFGWEVLEVCNDWRVNASCVPVPSHLLVS